MQTHRIILEKLIAYLNHQIEILELVDWAETTLIEPRFPDHENADLLMDVLTYLGEADSRGFSLMWEVLSDFMARLGGNVRAIVEVA